ncbi:hypothetical protein AVEN_132263-1 [Araneus ventricosus]|uniref:Uncharacterized protein n=1 Tax=Araneus ventricosus TaxID=182803 RepID=A0A4Y2TY58_ARAVE|nr:hypothetical protein AVEN_119965-1 [Araneus ventricosus]GBO05642.1 hypothetical protein AVEN_132263-1 [Araneus ventricosus]
MSRVRRIKKKKGSKKTLKVPRQQYVPPQRHQQDETEAEPNTKYHRTMSFILNWMCSFICFLLLMLVIAFSVDYDEILLLRYLSFLR